MWVNGPSRASLLATVRLDVPLWNWLVVAGFVGVLLIADLALFHRDGRDVSARGALVETVAWISLGLGFGLVMWAWHGGAAAGEYYSAFLIEQSLSVDNVFIWSLILVNLAVPRQYQFRVLFWGVFGAVALRACFVFAGVALLDRLEWLTFVFGTILLVTAARMARHSGADEFDPATSKILAVVRAVIPSTTDYHGHRLFTRVGRPYLATPLFAAVVLVEVTDLFFAVDSIPAVLGVSRDAFIVLTSNAFAILGLRSIYFLFSRMHTLFARLEDGLAVILAFVGVKMILEHWWHLSTAISLVVIAGVLVASVLASLIGDAERSAGPGPGSPDDR